MRIRRSLKARRGATIVETAIVVPIFFLLIIALFEFGRAFMVLNMLKVGARKAARAGVSGDLTTAEVEQLAKDQMVDVISSDNLTVYVKDAVEFDSASGMTTAYSALPDIDLQDDDLEAGRLFIVRLELEFNQISLVIPRWIAGDLTLTGQAMMRHEGNKRPGED